MRNSLVKLTVYSSILNCSHAFYYPGVTTLCESSWRLKLGETKLSQGEATNKQKQKQQKKKQLVGGKLHALPTLNNKLFFQFVVSKKVIRSETRSRRSLDMKFLNILSYKFTFQGFNVVTTGET